MLPGVMRRYPARRLPGAVILGLVAIGCCTLCGCAADDEDPGRFIQAVRARPLKPAPALPPLPPATPLRYSSAELRNPFRQPATRQGDAARPATVTARHREPEPLEAFAVSELALVGTLQLRTGHYGLIKTPRGDIVRVTPGNHLGRRHGRVLAIGDASLRLRELVPDGHGGRQAQITIIHMDDPP